MEQRLDIRRGDEARLEQVLQDARDEAVRAIDAGSGEQARGMGRQARAGRLLECEQVPARRDPQRPRKPEERVGLLVIVHRGGNPLARLNGARELRERSLEALCRIAVHHDRRLQLERRWSRTGSAALAEQRQESVLDRHDAQRSKRLCQHLGIVGGKRRVFEVELDRCVRLDGRHLAREQGVVDMRTQVLAHLALDLVRMGDDLVKAAVLRDKGARLLWADARHARDVVRGVALEAVEIRHELGGDAMVEVLDRLGRHDLDVRKALLGAHDLHVFGGELVHIAISGDEEHVATGGFARARERAEDVVALPSLGLEDGHLDLLQQLLDHGELCTQIGVHGRALRLVLWKHFHAHARLALIKGNRHAIGTKGINHLQEHVEKPEDGIRRTAIRRVHGWGHGVERTVHERVAVDDGERATIRALGRLSGIRHGASSLELG